MNDSEDKPAPSAWIPWILALAALFGWGSLAPDHLSIGNGKRQEGIGQIQQADDLAAPGGAHQPFAGLAPEPSGSGWHFGGSAMLLRIEARREAPVAEARGGGIQGRAPPLRA